MAVSSLSELWREVTAAQPTTPRWLVLTAATVALATVAYRPAWRVARNAVTIAHEGGHALAALLTGRRLSGIRLHADTSGVTVSYGKPYGFGMVLTALAGYVAPSLFGLAGAALLGRGHVTALLWVCVGLLALMLLMLRNFYGLLAVLATGALAFVVSWFADAKVQAAFAYLAVWFLLLGGVRPVFELQWQRRGGRAPNSDADQLGKLTRLPAGLWVFVFVIVALGSMLLGGHWLVPSAFHGTTVAH
ncbi:M50 family metallopeptidase [Actinocrinis puniceicyclus]|nr:M50 family metallopeptidase [Actinocrinis puniceicyclus]